MNRISDNLPPDDDPFDGDWGDDNDNDDDSVVWVNDGMSCPVAEEVSHSLDLHLKDYQRTTENVAELKTHVGRLTLAVILLAVACIWWAVTHQ